MQILKYQQQISTSSKFCSLLGSNYFQGWNSNQSNQSAVNSYPGAKTLKQVRAFLGLIVFNRYFMQKFGKIALPLFNLLNREKEFHWTEDCDKFLLKNFFLRAKMVIEKLPHITTTTTTTKTTIATTTATTTTTSTTQPIS